MKKFLLILLCFVFSYGDDLFITKYEYGEMLYNNPRGISCKKCHGPKGEGKFFVSFKERDKKTNTIETRNIQIPDIRNIPIAKFKDILQSTNNAGKIMPTYFLSNDEILAIHYYLQHINKKTK